MPRLVPPEPKVPELVRLEHGGFLAGHVPSDFRSQPGPPTEVISEGFQDDAFVEVDMFGGDDAEWLMLLTSGRMGTDAFPNRVLLEDPLARMLAARYGAQVILMRLGRNMTVERGQNPFDVQDRVYANTERMSEVVAENVEKYAQGRPVRGLFTSASAAAAVHGLHLAASYIPGEGAEAVLNVPGVRVGDISLLPFYNQVLGIAAVRGLIARHEGFFDPNEQVQAMHALGNSGVDVKYSIYNGHDLTELLPAHNRAALYTFTHPLPILRLFGLAP